MIKVSVMYPNAPGARFDFEYYRTKHLPMVAGILGQRCKSYAIDRGLGGGGPGAPAPYIAMCHLSCESVEQFLAAVSPREHEILADIANFTDQRPVMQISDVVDP